MQIRICRDDLMKKKFDEVFVDKTKYGTKIKTDEYNKNGKHLIIDQGQTDVAGYTDLEEGLFTEVPVVIFGDHTRVIKYVDKPFFLGADGTKVLRSKIADANYKYLYYALKSVKLPNTGYNRHFKWLKEVEIQYPEISKQKEIADILDRINRIINARKTELHKLDDLIKARFVEMFGNPEINDMHWDEHKLSDELSVIGGYAFKSDSFQEDGIPVLRIGNINAGVFRPINLVFWEKDDTLFKYLMYPGDLVMSLTGTVGKDDYGNVCILGSEYEMYYLNQRNAKLELKDGLDKYYLAELLKFPQIKKRLTGISRGVRQANISNKDILDLSVPIPPMKLQQQFADFVTQVDKSKVAVQKALDETQKLFDSLMQRYFG